MGIPIFLVETVKLLAEEAGLARGEGGIDLAALLERGRHRDDHAEDGRQAILARLDRFDRVVRSLLAAAAVLARDCHYQEICRILGSGRGSWGYLPGCSAGGTEIRRNDGISVT